MYILGLNGAISWIDNNPFNIGDGESHDAGAVITYNGQVIAAFEEERLNRIKHSNKLPVSAIKACLKKAGISAAQLDAVAVPTEEWLFDLGISAYRRIDPQFDHNSARDFIISFLKTTLDADITPDKIFFVNHHLAHAASSYYLSGFDKSLVISLDGSGDNLSGAVYEGENNTLNRLAYFTEQDSIGHFYLAVTRLLGFDIFDEYKVMGLAPYGDPEKYRAVFDQLYELKDKGVFRINKDLVKRLDTLLTPRQKGTAVTKDHQDIAAALQEATERMVFHLISYYRTLTGHEQLCLAGGVALNCTMTGKLRYAGLFRDVFIQPVSGDGGLPLGAALHTYFQLRPDGKREKLQHVYLGTECPDNTACMQSIEKWGDFISFRHSNNVTADTAAMLAAGDIIGWFQGAAEYGPRALGNRSILADPRPAENKDRINRCIKNREAFRPFAPSLLEEEATKVFELPDENNVYPYMGFILQVKETYRERLGAVTHTDGTARLQTVNRQLNPRYYKLIQAFHEMTGVPVVLNTSFNNNAEPIVDTPEDAMVCFLTSELNALVISDFIIRKKEFAPETILRLYPRLPDFVLLDKIGCKLSNTFNDYTKKLSAAACSLLSSCDGKKSLDQLAEEQLTAGELCAELLEELLQLWSARVVILSPEPQLTAEDNYAIISLEKEL